MSYGPLITEEQLRECMPGCRDPRTWSQILDFRLFEAGIVEPEQIAAFIAHTGHESMNYNTLEENLNYSEAGLRQYFKKYFPNGDYAAYARKPQLIANRVYSNRMGNGSESSGDGWRYRGRGVLQVTGKNNYTLCSEYLYGNKNILINDPDLLLEKDAAMMSAIWYWDINDLKNMTDFRAQTKAINGGLNGIDDRIYRYDIAIDVLTR